MTILEHYFGNSRRTRAGLYIIGLAAYILVHRPFVQIMDGLWPVIELAISAWMFISVVNLIVQVMMKLTFIGNRA